MQPLKGRIITWFIMLSKNDNTKKNNNVYRVLAITILSLSAVSPILITTTALDHASAQVSDSQNTTTTTVDGGPSTTTATAGLNTTSPTTILGGENQSTTAEVRSLIEQARMALQNNDIQGALMNLNSSLDALESTSEDEQSNNNMATTTPNDITDDGSTTTTTTEAGTVGSGGAGGAGTAGGIMTGGGT
ncbi:MAG: hypothetical protein ACJ71B_04790 [Nitrososphaera sp.]